MRELSAECAQILGMLVQAREQPLESSRERSDLVGAARLGHLQPDPPVVADRGIGGGAQPPDAHADDSRDAEGEQHRERGGKQREVEQMRQCPVAQLQQLIARLLEYHRAAYLLVPPAIGAAARSTVPGSPVRSHSAAGCPASAAATLLPLIRSASDDLQGP